MKTIYKRIATKKAEKIMLSDMRLKTHFLCIKIPNVCVFPMPEPFSLILRYKTLRKKIDEP